MIIDVSFFTELYHAEKIEDYFDLIYYMWDFKKEWYDKMNIYVEKHYIIPQFEVFDTDVITSDLIYLPASVHFKAHILRARESDSEQFKRLNYSKAIQVTNRFPDMKFQFLSEHDEAVNYYEKNAVGSYVEQAGVRGAERRKKKISQSMKALDQSIITNRNRSIQKYAASRPDSHNKAISDGRKKPVICLNTGITYDCAQSAANITNVPIHKVRKSCKTQKEENGLYFLYVRL
jgi:hypothetical protein